MRNSRYIKEVCVSVVSKTPLRVGNGKDESEILVDKSSNNPLIMGSSVAGAFRNYLYCLGEVDIDKVFGSDSDDDLGSSKVYVSDAYGDKLDIHSRVGIKRNDEYGTAKEGHIYNATYLNKGINFDFKFKMFACNSKELELFDSYIKLCVSGIINNNIRFGSKKTSGFGVFDVVKVKERGFDLRNSNDIKGYILDNKEFVVMDLSEYKNIISDDNFVHFNFKGSIKDSMIIKAKNANSDIDCESMNYDDDYIIPGTVIKGLCRSYSKKILKTLKKDTSVVEEIYGSETDNKDKGIKIMGRVYSQDAYIKDVSKCVYNRIKIDRFTGGVIETGKFDEERISGDVEFNISFKKSDDERLNDSCIAMISLFLRDLALSKVVIGSSSSVGSGRLIGKQVIIKDRDNIVEFGFSNDEIDISDKDYINDKINSLRDMKGAN